MGAELKYFHLPLKMMSPDHLEEVLKQKREDVPNDL